MKKETIKHTIVVFVLLLLAIFGDAIINKLFSQPSLGFSALSNGLPANVGFLIDNKIDLQLNAAGITGNNEAAKITTLTAGYRVLLSRNELNNYSVTPAIGYGLYRIKDFTGYDNDPTGKTGIKQINTNYPAASLNISKDIHIGKLYIQANYCKFFTYGMGFRVYFYRKLILIN